MEGAARRGQGRVTKGRRAPGLVPATLLPLLSLGMDSPASPAPQPPVVPSCGLHPLEARCQGPWWLSAQRGSGDEKALPSPTSPGQAPDPDVPNIPERWVPGRAAQGTEVLAEGASGLHPPPMGFP